MVSRDEMLGHLRLDKDYEDKLVYDISNYLLDNLDSLNIDAETKETIKINLNLIMEDSLRHSFIFSQLTDYVVNNAKDKY